MVKAKRKPIRPIDRFEVFKRDKFTCQYCNRTPPTVTLEVDHILAVTKGGSNDQGNLVTACFDCNRGKTNHLLTAVSQPLSDRMEEDQERASQIEAYNQFLLEKRTKIDEAITRIGYAWWNSIYNDKNKRVFGPERTPSIRRFLKELTESEILDSIDTAFSTSKLRSQNEDQVWKYFCGVCWRKIRERRGES